MDSIGKSGERKLNIQGNVDKSVIILGDGNTVEYVNVFSSIKAAQVASNTSRQLSRQEYQFRQLLVDNVKYHWIEGVLKGSLHNQALIELGLEDRSNTVVSPLSGIEEFPSEKVQTFPEGTQVTDIFDNLGTGRTLLILGEPGAGKTTVLLRLVQSLMDRLENDFSQLIPVVLNLSSWARKRQSIEKWIVQELDRTLEVNKPLGKEWIAEEQLILCLDGLDEVDYQHRNACIHALNTFIQAHRRTEVVVCSRFQDYESLSNQLKFRSAIYVQPLTAKQIDIYVQQAGEQLSALREAFKHNAEIKEFASSPLILSVMSFVYKGRSTNELPLLDNTSLFRKELFDAYISRMFYRRGTTHRYSDSQAKRWLVWTAKQMVKTSQTIFFIERMQPSWLETRLQKHRHRIGNILVGTILGSLIGSLIVGLMCIVASVIGVIIGYAASKDLLFAGLLTGLLSGAVFGFVGGVAAELFNLLASGLTNREFNSIEPVETLKWSWKEAKKAFISGASTGLITGIIIATLLLVTATLDGFQSSLIDTALIILFIAIACGLMFGLPSSFFGGFRGRSVQKSEKPNQGIWKSARYSLLLTLVSSQASGLLAASIGVLVVGPNKILMAIEWERQALENLSNGILAATPHDTSILQVITISPLFFGLLTGLIAWLFIGGATCVRHGSLRFELFRQSYIPWNYARFLDYATERLFLQKVGGGYIFIHRMLLEHFAQMELELRRKKTDTNL